MPDFFVFVASNDPQVKDHDAVARTIGCYEFDPDLHVETRRDESTGAWSIFVWGYSWPEAWRRPTDVKPEDFDPHSDSKLYAQGAEGFEQFLREIAGYLSEAFTVQAIGNTQCEFPLLACEWHVESGTGTLEITEFRHRWSTAL